MRAECQRSHDRGPKLMNVSGTHPPNNTLRPQYLLHVIPPRRRGAATTQMKCSISNVQTAPGVSPLGARHNTDGAPPPSSWNAPKRSLLDIFCPSKAEPSTICELKGGVATSNDLETKILMPIELTGFDYQESDDLTMNAGSCGVASAGQHLLVGSCGGCPAVRHRKLLSVTPVIQRGCFLGLILIGGVCSGALAWLF
jgi:hypothetical protein